MASHALTPSRPRAVPLSAMLATIPSLPRPVLARLTARMIERLDEMDGAPDDEAEVDRCNASDDAMKAGSSPGYAQLDRYTAGDALEEDEDDYPQARQRYLRFYRSRASTYSP